jgi:hypothetical protein
MEEEERTPATPAAQEDQSFFAEVARLMRDHPRWAIWLPADGRIWTAIRPAGSRPPTPDLPRLWVHAVTAGELGRLMQDVDQELSGGFTSR